MRKIPEVPFPLSSWLQALVQLVAALVWMLPLHWSPVVVSHLMTLEGAGQWFWSLGLWLVFGFLLGEVVVRQAQNLGFLLFARQESGFRVVTFFVTIACLQMLFVTLETLLIWMEAVMNPDKFPVVGFSRQWLQCFVHEGPLVAVFALGELVRQARYHRQLRTWFAARNLRGRGSPPVLEEREWEDS